MNIFVDAKMTDAKRRAKYISGRIFIHSPSESSLKLCRLAQEMIEEAFRPFDPLTLHENVTVGKVRGNPGRA